MAHRSRNPGDCHRLSKLKATSRSKSIVIYLRNIRQQNMFDQLSQLKAKQTVKYPTIQIEKNAHKLRAHCEKALGLNMLADTPPRHHQPHSSRPNCYQFTRACHGPALVGAVGRPIKFSEAGPRPGPARQLFQRMGCGPARPIEFRIASARPGPAHQFFKFVDPARPGPCHSQRGQ